jgi:hypothetical protein
MGLPTLAPILEQDLPEFCEFLHRNLNPRIAPAVWAEAFQQRWGVEKPNNGFLVRDAAGQLVGGIGAIYSEYPVRGHPERFCNITSWCVLEPYRAQSMRLAMAVVSQPGWHFTDLSPTEVVAGSLRFLKFQEADATRTLIPNLPWPLYGLDGVKVTREPSRIGAVLPPASAKVYRDHRHFPWLRHVAVGRAERWCHVAYKPGRLRGLPTAVVLGLSDPEIFPRYHRTLGTYLLLRHGMVATRVERRLLAATPKLSLQVSGYRSKLYRSDTLAASDIVNFYSEVMALDL